MLNPSRSESIDDKKMRHNFIIFILCLAIPLCWTAATNQFQCKKYDQKTKTFAYYCTDYAKYSDGKAIENCSSRIDAAQKVDVINFEIHGCTNETVRKAVLELPNLHSMDISYSGFQTMDSFNYSHQQVETFNMSHNRIVEYKWIHFMELLGRFPQLSELDLSYNDLHAIHVFGSIDGSIIKLKKLYFHHNNITHIQSGAFVNLTELEMIDLSHNRLTRIFANAFSNAQMLQELHLEHNPIDFFVCDDLLNQKNFKFQVHLSWENVEYFNTDCIGLDLPSKYFIISNRHEAGLRPLAENYRIDCDHQNFQQIRTFKAGPNKYRSILTILRCFGSELLELDLTGNSIELIDQTMFRHFEKLTDLTLSQTQLKTFDFQWLQQQKQLISLDISHNGLELMENVLLCGNLRSLETFVTAGNRLRLLDFLQKLPKTIKNLDVSNSKIFGELKPEYFENMPDLEEIYLRSLTKLTFPNVNPFGELKNLIVLDISHNNLKGMDLTPMAATFQKLREFRAADCNIDNAIDLINQFGMDLWTLDLSGNFIGDLSDDSPLQRLNLLKLFLNRANISQFDLNTLSESNSLAYFEIANNSLIEIDLTPLSINIMELKMQSNQLEVIIGLTPEHFKKLQYLNIGKNHLPCEYLTELANDFARKNAHFEEWDKFAETCLKTNDDNNTHASTEAEIKTT